MSGRALLILRPEPGASATAARGEAAGWSTIRAPLFEMRALAWEAPSAIACDAVMLTSAHAARLAGPALSGFRALPLYAVGAATAAAARAAGFAEVRAGDGDAADLIARAGDDGVRRLLHLAGREHRAASHPGIEVERRTVYAADAVDALPEAARSALAEGAIALLHSPRAAASFRALLSESEVAHAAIAAISPAALAAAGSGWRAAAAAPSPTDDALLAAAARLCE